MCTANVVNAVKAVVWIEELPKDGQESASGPGALNDADRETREYEAAISTWEGEGGQ